MPLSPWTGTQLLGNMNLILWFPIESKGAVLKWDTGAVGFLTLEMPGLRPTLLSGLVRSHRGDRWSHLSHMHSEVTAELRHRLFSPDSRDMLSQGLTPPFPSPPHLLYLGSPCW